MTTLLRELGLRLVTYIDDMLVMVASQQTVRDFTLGLICLLENLGFITHPEKMMTTSTQGIEFLGMKVHLQSTELRLPDQKIKGNEASESGCTSDCLGGVMLARQAERSVASSSSWTALL